MTALLRLILLAALIPWVAACSSYSQIRNSPLAETPSAQSYSIQSFSQQGRSNNTEIMLAFSGGGTRAAALSYGVLEALRDTAFESDGQVTSLLDEVDSISSVSGGSFTAAYYGLFGDRIFQDFEHEFLRRDVGSGLFRELINPMGWFDSRGRTESTIAYYDKYLFKGATFADMMRQDGPLVLINATDIANDVRFTFVQEYFSLLCSDLSSFPVARAVAASAAVPVVFNPIVLKNYDTCGSDVPEWLKDVLEKAKENPELRQTVNGLIRYYDKQKRQYAHFLDGGLTDNLGLRSVYDVVGMAGGASTYLELLKIAPPKRIVVISVDASVKADLEMYQSHRRASVSETINSLSRIQIDRYNATTKNLIRNMLTQWADELSTPANPIEVYLVQLEFSQLGTAKDSSFFDSIPTSFTLGDEQVDRLIDAGHQLLLNNSEFRRLESDLQISLIPSRER